MKAALDLTNYATKANLKNATDVDTLYFAKQADLDNLKIDVDKLDIDNLRKYSKSFKQFEIDSK